MILQNQKLLSLFSSSFIYILLRIYPFIAWNPHFGFGTPLNSSHEIWGLYTPLAFPLYCGIQLTTPPLIRLIPKFQGNVLVLVVCSHLLILQPWFIWHLREHIPSGDFNTLWSWILTTLNQILMRVLAILTLAERSQDL